MACFHSKETAFGRDKGYVVCRNFQTTGHVRCPKKRCPLFADDGKGTEPTLLGKCACTVHYDLNALGRASRALDKFFDGALRQMPDGGAAYDAANDRFLPHRLMELT